MRWMHRQTWLLYENYKKKKKKSKQVHMML